MARTIAFKQGVRFGNAMVKSKLTISTKSECLSNTPLTAERLAKHIRHAKLPMRAVKNSQDIGMATTAGKTRSVKTTTKRILKAKKQARRMGILATKKNQTKKNIWVVKETDKYIGVPK